jgi:hypothetical protein
MRFCFSRGAVPGGALPNAPREQRPDEERVRSRFCRLFYPRAAAYVAFLAPKNWVLQPENRPGRNRRPGTNSSLENGPR